METLLYFAGFGLFVYGCYRWVKHDIKKNKVTSYRKWDYIFNVETKEIGIVNGVDNYNKRLYTSIGEFNIDYKSPESKKVKSLRVGDDVTIVATQKRVKVWGFDGPKINTSKGSHHHKMLKA